MKSIIDVIGFITEHSGKLLALGGTVADVVALWRRANATINTDGSVNQGAYAVLVADNEVALALLRKYADEARANG